MTVDLPREAALKIICDIDKKGAYSNIALNKYFKGHDYRILDKAFITDMVYGTLKWKLTIDFFVEKFSSVKIKKLSPWILNILRLGIYQLIFTDKIPESAACNESVKLAKKYGHMASSRYVNAVLRNIARNRDNIEYPDRMKDIEGYLSVKYSHPQWMVNGWLNRFGEEFTEGLLISNNETPPFIVRVNTLKISCDELIAELKNKGFEAKRTRYMDDALVIENPASVFESETYKQGCFQVQDESSMLVGRVLGSKPGEFVMDVCSAPGGKSTYIAQMMGNKGDVLARDVHEHKIALIDEAKKRLGLDIIKTEVFDATLFDKELEGKADRVLVDAPCTGFGIIRRKPDIKWSRNLEDKREIIKLQEKILDTSSKYVKPGGVLVYSTCTIEREENEEVVENFTKANREFDLEDISNYLAEGFCKETAKKGYIQLYPHIDGTDGFFIARMRRRS
jgi:16S rRNA (cytosine967-C5)-methyltransferase